MFVIDRTLEDDDGYRRMLLDSMENLKPRTV